MSTKQFRKYGILRRKKFFLRWHTAHTELICGPWDVIPKIKCYINNLLVPEPLLPYCIIHSTVLNTVLFI